MTLGLIVVAALSMYLLAVAWTYRYRFYLATGRDQGYAIPTARLQDFHPPFRTGRHGPGLAAEVVFIGGAESVKAGVTDREAWILSVLAKEARTIFEFGTATGKTTYLLARNAAPEARVVTITLDPAETDGYRHEKGDGRKARDKALGESIFRTFLYSGTDVESKITQLFGDSKTFDPTPYSGQCDLIFVDGAHAYSYVMNDSRKAFEMLSPTGIILWHDYKKKRATRDVVRALNELSRERRLVRLAGTHLVVHKAAWSGSIDDPLPEQAG
jgi:predicted O-methyltransferase YrrM